MKSLYKVISIVILWTMCTIILLPNLAVHSSSPSSKGSVILFSDNFESVAYGAMVPEPWIQEGALESKAKTSSSSSAPSAPILVKIDSKDVLTLPLDTTAYKNIKVSYYTRASSYSSGSILVEWSADGGSTWGTLEDFKITNGASSSPNTLMIWSTDAAADNNPNFRVRFSVGDEMKANMYIDSVEITGDLIPGSEPKPTPTIVPEGTPPPFLSPKGVIMHEDVEIGTAGNKKLFTSIVVPETPPEKPMPVAIYIHGGGWNKGARKDSLNSICNYVTKRGYIGVTLDYRLTTEEQSVFPAQLQDVKLAIRFLRANAAKYYIDPDRIGVWGTSSGAHLAALLGTTGELSKDDIVTLDTGNTVDVPDFQGSGGWQEYSDKVQAVIDFYGPADFTSDFANGWSSVKALLGGSAFKVTDAARLAMPGTFATPDDAAIFIRHGTSDQTVPYQDSEKFYTQLKTAGVPIIDYALIEGQIHGFSGKAKEENEARAWEFLDKHVKNKEVTEHILYKSIPISVKLDGNLLKFDVKPTIINGRTLLPLRTIFEALNVQVGWDSSTSTVTGKKGDTAISLKIDSKEALVNGKVNTLDAPAIIVGGRTLIPARFIAESLGAKVDWDDKMKTVIITTK